MKSPTNPEDLPKNPTNCPYCGSSKISVPVKKVDVSTYWRCEACNQMWNVSRHRSSAPDPYRSRWNGGR